jgi:adenine-specific DNA-methyltransferase
VSKEKFLRLDEDGRIWWGKDGDSVPAIKRFLSEVKEGLVPQTLWFYKDVGHTQDAKKELLSIIDFQSSDEVFITPKPTNLIKRILQIATDDDSIILDSFAGSGTTGQAVLALNAEDGGNRKFILIEQEDYADTLTAERVRRVIRGVPGARDEKLKAGYGGSFTYLTLGEALEEGAALKGERLPGYGELARYVFFTATGEQLDEAQVDESRWYLGESKQYEVYMIYRPDVAFLKNNPLNLDFAQSLPSPQRRGAGGEVKTRLVIASHKYLDDDYLRDYRLEFCQLPFAIYRFRA